MTPPPPAGFGGRGRCAAPAGHQGAARPALTCPGLAWPRARAQLRSARPAPRASCTEPGGRSRAPPSGPRARRRLIHADASMKRGEAAASWGERDSQPGLCSARPGGRAGETAGRGRQGRRAGTPQPAPLLDTVRTGRPLVLGASEEGQMVECRGSDFHCWVLWCSSGRRGMETWRKSER